MKRREFLKSAWNSSCVLAASTALSTVSGCSSLDRFFSLERDDYENEVIILGAGAAGLSAAYELKKRKIPFRIFEASSRVGGRVYTLRSGVEGFDPIELGAESFSKEEKILFQMGHELNLNIIEHEIESHLEPILFQHNQKWYSASEKSKNLKNALATLYRLKYQKLPKGYKFLDREKLMELPQWQNLDLVSAEEFIKREKINLDPLSESYVRSQIKSHLALDYSEVSALAWLLSLDEENSRSHFRIEGGFSQLTYNLFERISGATPHKQIVFDHELKSVSRDNENLIMIFNTKEGLRKIKCRFVIVALPFSQLKKISGLQSIGLSSDSLSAISSLKLSNSQKFVFKFSEPFWRSKSEILPANQGQYYGGKTFSKSWDSSWDHINSKSSVGGTIANYQLSFINNDQQIYSGQNVYSEIQKIFFNSNSKGKEISYIDYDELDWSKVKFIEGNQLVFRPAQLSQFDSQVWRSELEGRWQWAGSHTAAYNELNRVSGALSSGQQAAIRLASIFSLS